MRGCQRRSGPASLSSDAGRPAPGAAWLGRVGDRHVGPLDQALPIGQEATDQPGEAGVSGVKSGPDGVGGHLRQLTGDDGGEHWAASRLHDLDFRGAREPGIHTSTPRLLTGAS